MPLLLSPFTAIGLSRDVQIISHKSTKFILFNNSLLRENILAKARNGESNQWHEWPAIVKCNLKSILVFVKQPHCSH